MPLHPAHCWIWVVTDRAVIEFLLCDSFILTGTVLCVNLVQGALNERFYAQVCTTVSIK